MHVQRIKLFLLGFILFQGAFTQSLQEVYAEGTKAYENQDYTTFLSRMIQADSMRPDHQTILYNLAAGLALNKKEIASIATLRRALWINAEMAFEQEKDFATLIDDPSFIALTKEINQLREATSAGELAFKLDEVGFHPEGIAYSEKLDQFYLGSVRQGKIILVDGDEPQDFLSDTTFMSIMGLQVDERNNLLWVCSTPAPEMIGFKEGLKAEIICIDLIKKQILKRYQAPKDRDWLGDLIVAKSGDVFASNSNAENPVIYKISQVSDEMKVLVDASELISLQGLALNKNETALFFSDYRYGLFKFDLQKEELIKLESQMQNPLKGIDGLYFYDDDLIAIHNGLRPFRVVRYELDKSQSKITDFKFLEKGLPEMNEPTLGVVVGSELYYIVNSPWGAYDQNKNFLPEKAASPIIRKIKLN